MTRALRANERPNRQPRERGFDILDMRKAPPRELVVNHVHRELRRAILMGWFPPHSRLVEVALADMLSVSRTPIREAISKLETEGLVRRAGGRGVVVEDVSSRRLEISIMRQGIESAAVRLACMRATDEELAGILASAEEAAAQADVATLRERSDHDREFHGALARASGSARLNSLLEEFYEYSFGALMPNGSPRDTKLLRDQHVEIARSLVRRDVDAAERLIREHLETVLSMSKGLSAD